MANIRRFPSGWYLGLVVRRCKLATVSSLILLEMRLRPRRSIRKMLLANSCSSKWWCGVVWCGVAAKKCRDKGLAAQGRPVQWSQMREFDSTK